MLETLNKAPPDPIIGLTEAFGKDPNPEKINLGVGVYKDEHGNTPVFATVRETQERLLQAEKTKNYTPIEGTGEFSRAVQGLLFGEDHEIIATSRAATVQSPGGTGALRIAADFVHKLFPGTRVWISDPSWANHPKVFEAAGIKVGTYAYFDDTRNELDLDAMLASLNELSAGEVVLLHGCCHNPTGVDPNPEEWKRIGNVVQDRGLIPLVDFAYQGMGIGVDADAVGLRELCRPGVELFIANSFSKNFGLYNERVGALTIIGGSDEAAAAALSHAKICIRTNYSNPPAHGAALVTAILADADRRMRWEGEVAGMRDRIVEMRSQFVETLKQKGIERDFSFIARQRGMFSFSGLTGAQVDALRNRYSIYVVSSGRINVAGMTHGNMDHLCEAIADVLGG